MLRTIKVPINIFLAVFQFYVLDAFNNNKIKNRKLVSVK